MPDLRSRTLRSIHRNSSRHCWQMRSKPNRSLNFLRMPWACPGEDDRLAKESRGRVSAKSCLSVDPRFRLVSTPHSPSETRASNRRTLVGRRPRLVAPGSLATSVPHSQGPEPSLANQVRESRLCRPQQSRRLHRARTQRLLPWFSMNRLI